MGYVIREKDPAIIYFDSFQDQPAESRYIQSVLNGLIHKHISRTAIVGNYRSIRYIVPSKYKQTDLCNCGVFLAKWWYHISKDKLWETYQGEVDNTWRWDDAIIERARLIAKFTKY